MGRDGFFIFPLFTQWGSWNLSCQDVGRTVKSRCWKHLDPSGTFTVYVRRFFSLTCMLVNCKLNMNNITFYRYKLISVRRYYSNMVVGKWGFLYESSVLLSVFPHSSINKESACNTGDLGSIPGLGRAPGEGNGHPLQYSCLENSMDRESWQVIVHRVTKSWTWLSD